MILSLYNFLIYISNPAVADPQIYILPIKVFTWMSERDLKVNMFNIKLLTVLYQICCCSDKTKISKSFLISLIFPSQSTCDTSEKPINLIFIFI